MKCNSKSTIKRKLIKKGVITDDDQIIKVKEFKHFNTRISRQAADNYRILEGDLLSIHEDIAIFNDKAFELIDEFKEDINNNIVKDIFDELPEKTIEPKSKKGPKKELSGIEKERFERDYNYSVAKLTKRINDIQEHRDRYLNVDKNHARLDKIVHKLDDTIKQYVQISKDTGSKYATNVKSLSSSISKVLIDDILDIDTAHYLKILLDYVEFSNKQLHSLTTKITRLKTMNTSKPEFKNLLNHITTYKNSFTLLQDIQLMLQEFKDEGYIKEAEYDSLKRFFMLTQGAVNEVDNSLQLVHKKFFLEHFGNTRYFTKVYTKYKNEFEKKSNSNEKLKTREEKTQWVNQQLMLNKDKIENETYETAKDFIENNKHDISELSYYFNTDPNLRSDFIEIATIIYSNKETNKMEATQSYLRTFDKKFKDIGATQEDFNKIVQKDMLGNYYLMGNYHIDFYTTLKELDLNIEKSLTPEDKAKHQLLRKQWIAENTSDVPMGEGWVAKNINPKWKNNIEGLTTKQQELLKYLQEVTRLSDKKTKGRKSLLKKHKLVKGTLFYELPAVLKTTYAKMAEGDIWEAVKKFKRERTQIEQDDINEGLTIEAQEYLKDTKVDRVYAGIDGKPLGSIFVAYRGKLGAEQNLDLKTIYALEIDNFHNVEANLEADLEIQNLIELAKNSSFYVKRGFGERHIQSIYKSDKLEDYDTMLGVNSNTLKKLLSQRSANIYSQGQIYAGTVLGMDVNRLTSSFIGYSSYITMALRTPGALANLINGNIQSILDAVGGEFFSKEDLAWAHKEYFANFGSILNDVGSPIKFSKINMLLEYFDVMGMYTQIDNQFERSNKVTQLMKFDTLFGLYTAGEHQMQSIIMLATLKAQKALNKDNEFVNKEGTVVDSKNAASVYDMFSVDKDTNQLVRNPALEHTSHTPINDWLSGGQVSLKMLIKGIVFRNYGMYDKKRNSHVQRIWYGSLLLHFKKWLESMMLRRFRGLAYVATPEDAMPEHVKYNNPYLKTSEEGFYVTFFKRYYEAIRMHKLNLLAVIMEANKKNQPLTNHQLANFRRANAEILTIMIVTATAMLLASAAADDDDDDSLLWNAAYQFRRAQNELTQFYNPLEFKRIYKNPIAAFKQLDAASNIVGSILMPWDINEEYKVGEHKGKNKFIHKTRKALIPNTFILNYENDAKKLYTFYDNPGIIN